MGSLFYQGRCIGGLYIRVVGRRSVAFWAWALDGDLFFSFFFFFCGLEGQGMFVRW